MKKPYITDFCCDDMKNNILENRIIIYNEIVDEYGIGFPEDDISYMLIDYCPWCGKKLPDSKREQWFNELEQLGFDNPLLDDSIPEIYKTGKWRLK